MRHSLVHLLTFVLTKLPWMEANCSNNVTFSRHHDQALLGHVIDTVETNYLTCVEKCSETNGCRSVNYCRDKDGKETCNLNRSSKTLRPESVIANSSCEHDEITRRGDCTSQVCLDKHIEWHSFNSSLFCLVKDQMTWNEARLFCRSLRGDLASVASQQEKEFIDSTLLSAAPQGNSTNTRLIALWKLDGTDAQIKFHGRSQIRAIDGYKALYLDGKNTSFATTPSIRMRRRSFTVGAWVKLVKPASPGVIFGSWSSPYQFSVLVNDNGTVSAHLHFRSGEFAQVHYSSIPFNVWVHVMFSWSRKIRCMLIRINGVQKAQYVVPSYVNNTNLFSSVNKYDIGLDRNQSTIFHGYLRELGIHNLDAKSYSTASKRIGRWDKFKGVWIGLNDLTSEGNFVYSDWSVVTYDNWKEKKDATNLEDCVAIFLPSKTHSWFSQSCGEELPFICRKNG